MFSFFNKWPRGCASVPLFLLLCLAQPSLAARASQSLTLEQALNQTLANNPLLYQFRLRQQVLQSKRQTSALKPQLALNLEVENFAGSGAKQDFKQAETSLSLSSVFEFGGKVGARMSVASARLARLDYQQQAATLDVLGDVTAQFIDTVATQEQIKLARDAQVLAQRMVETVRNRAQRGAAAEADVLRARATLARAEIALAGLQEKLDRQKVSLALFWKQSPANFTQLQGDLLHLEASRDFASLFDAAKDSPAIEVLASSQRLKAAELSLAQAQASTDIQWQVGVKHFAETDDHALTAGVSIPLFNRQRSAGNQRVAAAEYDAVSYQQESALLKLHARLYQAYSLRQQNIAAQKKIQQNILPALEQALQLTQEAYENGRYRYQDWLMAQDELLQARQQLISNATTAWHQQALIEQLTAQPLSPQQ